MKKKNGGAELPRKSNSETKSGQKSKRAKARGPVQRDSKEVMAELVAKLTERLGSKPVPANATEVKPQGALAPNRDRLTVGVDLGDQWSNYCILGLEGETLAEGQLRTTQQDVTEFFQALSTARVIIEVGTHSAWVREVVVGCGHEVLVANPRLMDGTRRRKRKNDRVDANNLARVGRIDPQSLFPIEHRSTEVRQDLVVLRARDALVAVRTQLIKVREWLSRIDKDSKDARNKRIFDMWLSCHTDADIAGAVDLSEEGVRKITQQMAELPEVGKPPASHLSDFEIPLYNVWKQQEKTAGAGHFGNSEVRWVDNLLYLYTRPFDIVVDPFGGGPGWSEPEIEHHCSTLLEYCWLQNILASRISLATSLYRAAMTGLLDAACEVKT